MRRYRTLYKALVVAGALLFACSGFAFHSGDNLVAGIFASAGIFSSLTGVVAGWFND